MIYVTTVYTFQTLIYDLVTVSVQLSSLLNTNFIEDEQHFALVCNEYSQLREIMFSKVRNLEFNVMSNEEKLVYLTNHYWKELNISMEKAWDKRNEILCK